MNKIRKGKIMKESLFYTLASRNGMYYFKIIPVPPSNPYNLSSTVKDDFTKLSIHYKQDIKL